MKCASCGYEEVQAGARFCSVCGAPQPLPAAVACPTCGEENRPGARFCQVCGQPLPESEAEPVRLEASPGGDLPDLDEPLPAEPTPPAPLALQDPLHSGAPASTVGVVAPSPGEPGGKEPPWAGPVPPAVGEQPVPGGGVAEAAPAEAAEALPSGEGATPLPAAPALEGQPPPGGGVAEAAPAEAAVALPSSEEATPLPAPLAVEGQLPPGSGPVEAAPTAGEGEATEAVCDRTTAVEIGTVIGGRYRVIELLPAEEGDGSSRVVAVADLSRCWACDWQVDDPTEPYCEQCGVDLASPPPERRLLLRETVAPGDDTSLPDGALVESGRLYTPERQPWREQGPATTSSAVFAPGVRLAAGQATDPGQQRDLNEDSFLALTLNASPGNPAVGMYMVADGIGGYEGGEWASRLAVQVIAEALLCRIVLPVASGEVKLPLLEEAVFDHLRQAVEAANLQIHGVRTGRVSDMGTTLTLALVLDNLAYVANVGDSRTYLWGQDGLRQVTVDHSLVARLIAAGTAQPNEIYTHPQRNAIYRSLGDKVGVEIDVFTESLAPGNELVLCCDGLWDMVRNEGIEEVLLLGLPPQAACDELVRRANQAGGEDNISVIVVRAENSGQTGR